MKRLYIAAVLLTAVAALCLLSNRYHHRQIDRMLQSLDHIEQMARAGDTDALPLAETFAAEYRRLSDLISGYVSHNELRESREAATLLPTLLREQNEDELYMEIARLRGQLLYLRQVDDPLLQNIL